MRFVTLAALAGLFALPAPVLAQEAEALPDPDVAMNEALYRAASEMADPERQEQVAALAGTVLEAMLDMPVGPLMRAAETMAGRDGEDIDPDLTLADVAGPDALDSAEEISERLPEMMQTLAAFTYAMDGVLPEMRRTVEAAAEKMAKDLPRGDR